MQSHVEFVKTIICSEEMAVQYLRESDLLDDPEEAVINCDKCGSVMQIKKKINSREQCTCYEVSKKRIPSNEK
jgi:hypothetical protein